MTAFDWEDHPSARIRCRKVLRLIVCHFFVVIEYFQRTGQNATKDKATMDVLRANIARLTGEKEFKSLYHGDRQGVAGSVSTEAHANPITVRPPQLDSQKQCVPLVPLSLSFRSFREA